MVCKVIPVLSIFSVSHIVKLCVLSDSYYPWLQIITVTSGIWVIVKVSGILVICSVFVVPMG